MTGSTNGSAPCPSSWPSGHAAGEPGDGTERALALGRHRRVDRWIHWYAVPVASTSEAAIEAMPISLPFIGIRLPKPDDRANAMPGMSAISQAFSRNQPD